MEFELIRMKYAFAMQLAEQVIEADDVILKEEKEYFDLVFPEALLQKLALEDPKDVKVCYEKAVDELPERLDLEQKLEIFGLLLGASVADDFLEFREFGVLEASAKILGIPPEIMMDYIDGMFLQD